MAANNTLPGGGGGVQKKRDGEKGSIEMINESRVKSKPDGPRTCEAVIMAGVQAVCVK